MKRDYNELLKHALAPMDEPDFWLNRKLLRQVREEEKLEKRNFKKIPAVVLAATLVICAGSLTTVAAYKLLTPKQVAQEVQDNSLVDAFLSEDAVFVNETQSYGGYKVTFLGIISGEDLSDGIRMRNDVIHNDRSHIVVAIENADGSPMPDTSEDAYGELEFFVSPYIKGYRPGDYNAVTMTGNYADVVEDGVLYRILECDNVEMFADCGLYLGVSDGVFYNANAYCYEETTGELCRNETYKGLNALFSLPIDAAKADPEAAALYLETLFSEEGVVDADTNTDIATAWCTEVEEWLANLTVENIDEVAARVENTVQVLSVDEDGYLTVAPYEIEGRGGAGEKKMLASWAFPDTEVGMIESFFSTHSGTLETVRVETFTKNEDGTYTFAVYIPKE